MTRARVAVVNGPVDGLRDGWDDVCARWGRAIDLEVAAATAPDEDGLLGSLREADSSADGIVLNVGTIGHTPAVVDAVGHIPTPVVHVSLDEVADPGEPADRGGGRLVQGRGFAGYFWALRLLAAWRTWPGPTARYGPGPGHVGDLRIPAGRPPFPTCVLLHGGFWRHGWERDSLAGLGAELARQGWLTWTPAYRRLGPTGGGWPTTWDDVAAAVDGLPDVAPPGTVDPHRIVLLGHSVGAALAIWATARSDARVRPAGVASLAGVLDLRYAAEMGLGEGATVAALGEPADHADRYEVVSPVERLPLGIPIVLVHGADDEVVPPTVTPTFEALAVAAGDDVRAHIVDGADHFDPILPEHEAWGLAASELDELTGR